MNIDEPAWGGWWPQARWLPSPHWDARPPGVAVDLLVIHNISLPPGQFDGDHIGALFLGRLDLTQHAYFATLAGLRVSAHFLIRRDGAVVQFVGTDRRAWHAGQSHWAGRDRCNDFSIGIELEGTDHMPYEEAQYLALVSLVTALRRRYGLPVERIVGHEDIAPQRKTDPGPAFDWSRFRHALK